jgi:2',3'-cyclic-nucleotide 2'-phosphodiesterase (5'-nucleotidase family)
MKRIIAFISILLVVFTITACDTPEVIDDKEEFDLCEQYPSHIDCIDDTDDTPDDPDDEVDATTDFIDIYYLNDFHGAIEQDGDSIGFSRIGNFLQTQIQESPNSTIVLSGGDMLQGSALSNYYNGLSTIELMDLAGFDAMTLGNHEFDWGLDTVLNYFDEDESNGEADFPILGANVFYEGTTTIPEHIDPYTIIERGDVRIGVIGTMGYGLEYSIAQSRIDGYEFAYPVPIIEQYAIELRTQEDCDIVIWVGHDSGYNNDDILALSGDAKIDALFNAHSHSEYANDSDHAPVMQSGDTGEYVGHIKLMLDENNQVMSYTAENLSEYSSALFFETYEPIETLINQYISETDSIFNVGIIETDEYLSVTDLSRWLCQVMVASTDADIAFQNIGGTRASISDNEMITMGVLYEVWPFDNVVKTVYLDGATINNLKSSLVYYTDMNFEEGTMYKVATNDYVFDKPENPFIDGLNPENTGIVLRDLVEQELILQSQVFDFFLLVNEIQTSAE